MDATKMEAFIRGEAMKDREFSRAMRYFDGTVKVAVEDEEMAFHFTDGKLNSDTRNPDDADCEIVIRGNNTHWTELLAQYPIPFYQCLQTTSVRHGMYLNNTNQFYAYLPALNRLTSLLRTENNRLIGAKA